MLEMAGSAPCLSSYFVNIVFRCIMTNVGYWMASLPNLQLLYRGQVKESYRHLA